MGKRGRRLPGNPTRVLNPRRVRAPRSGPAVTRRIFLSPNKEFITFAPNYGPVVQWIERKFPKL